jgi:hypothetical protein
MKNGCELKSSLWRKLIWLAILMMLMVLTGGGITWWKWKREADRRACILNLCNVNNAATGHANMMNLKIGDPLAWSEIIGPGKYLEMPRCPAGGTYHFMEKVPKIGELYMECSLHDEPYNHSYDKSLEDWGW